MAFSRVHTGAHYPTDVLAGLGLGAAVAVALTRSWPSRPPANDRAAAAEAELPALPDGAGLVVVNPASGPG